MVVSVTSPVSPALERVRAVLFAPFELEKWLKLGFCAFLAGLLEGGGGFNFYGASEDEWDLGPGTRASEQLERGRLWLEQNMATAVAVVALTLAVISAIVFLLLWLRSRGRFMLIDGVVRNRGAVSEPWHDYKREANSLLSFEVCLTLAVLALLGLAVATGVAIAWSDIRAERFQTAAGVGLGVGLLLTVTISVTAAIISLFLKDLVVPAMYARRIGVLEAWAVVRHEVLAPRAGTMVLYVLMKMLLAFVAGVGVMALGCATLCIGFCLMAIPYVGSVLLLPISVFDRSFSLYFLAQLGGPWQLLPDVVEPAAPADPTDGVGA